MAWTKAARDAAAATRKTHAGKTKATKKPPVAQTKELIAHSRAERATLKRHGTTAGFAAENTYKRFYLAYRQMKG